jgi:tRNA(fMet)-specific endonuclease VapC
MALYMLDTGTVSYALRGNASVVERLKAHRRSALCLSSIIVGELRFGATKRDSKKIHRAIDAFLTGVDVMPFDLAAADRFGTIAAALSDAGEPIGQMDTLIAAHALSLAAVLVTNNEKHFSKVRGLKLENWADTRK